MPTLSLELTIDDLLYAVSQLDETELTEFQIRFEQLWLSRIPVNDKEAAQIAAARRLSVDQQARLHSLLEKNREASLTEAETAELDNYLKELDQALEKTADELLELAKKRKQTGTGKTS